MKLVLGPLLRHAGTDEATIWVQTSAPGTVEVRPAGRPAATERTFTVNTAAAGGNATLIARSE